MSNAQLLHCHINNDKEQFGGQRLQALLINFFLVAQQQLF